MGSVMIVDDSEDIRRMLRAVVADFAEPIYECRDGNEACAAYVAHRPDCVLMDISMTPTDGLTATRNIVRMFPEARIVIVTQYDDARLRSAALQAGACGYVLKDNLLDVRRFLKPSP